MAKQVFSPTTSILISPGKNLSSREFNKWANSLYLESTFTPELEFNGVETATYLSTPLGYCIKIGNINFITVYFVLTAKGAGAGVITIAGLPPSNNLSDFVMQSEVRGITNVAVGKTFGLCTAFTATIINDQYARKISMKYSATAGANDSASLLAADINNAAEFRITGFYKATP